jgi:hypothetical protein
VPTTGSSRAAGHARSRGASFRLGAERAGTSSEPKPADPALLFTGLLVALVLMDVTCAFVVAVLPSVPALSLTQLLALLAPLTLDRQPAGRTRAASTTAAWSSRSSAAR